MPPVLQFQLAEVCIIKLVDICSVNVIPHPCKALRVEIPTTAQPLRAGPGSPSVQSQICPALAWAALYLGRCFSPLAQLLLRDGAEFTAKPRCWHEECDSPHPATDVFQGAGWWPELPGAVINCLVMTQMAGSNFSPAAGWNDLLSYCCSPYPGERQACKFPRCWAYPVGRLYWKGGLISFGGKYLLCSGLFFWFKHLDLFLSPSHHFMLKLFWVPV